MSFQELLVEYAAASGIPFEGLVHHECCDLRFEGNITVKLCPVEEDLCVLTSMGPVESEDNLTRLMSLQLMGVHTRGHYFGMEREGHEVLLFRRYSLKSLDVPALQAAINLLLDSRLALQKVTSQQPPMIAEPEPPRIESAVAPQLLMNLA